jgi:dolichol-phosphate mannosyltransferase
VELKDTLIIIPTYNEAPNAGKLIEELFSLYPDVSILIVDDNSPDKTADIIRVYQQKHSRLFLLERPTKEGLGIAYQAGFKWALKRSFEFIVQMDADFSHSPKDVIRLRKALSEADIAIGSRYIKGGQTLNWPLSRKLISRIASFIMKSATKLPLRDASSGFKCFKRKGIEIICESSLQSKGYVFQCEVNYTLARNGMKIIETPIIFSQRTHGKSKMSLSIVTEGLFILMKIRINELMKPEKKSPR